MQTSETGWKRAWNTGFIWREASFKYQIKPGFVEVGADTKINSDSDAEGEPGYKHSSVWKPNAGQPLGLPEAIFCLDLSVIRFSESVSGGYFYSAAHV